MSFLPDSEDIFAIKELINSPGFVVGASLAMTGALVYFLVVPIPQKLDDLIIAVKTSKCIIGEVIHDSRGSNSSSK